MENSPFFDFSTKLTSTTFQAGPINLLSGIEGINQVNSLVKGNYESIDFPIVFKQDYGKKLTDILGTGHVILYLISDKFKLLLEENNLSGWKNYPIKLLNKKNVEIVGYHGFSITGNCAGVNFKNSKIIEKKYVPDGPIVKLYKGIEIDEWEGTDFFIPKNTMEIFVSKKAANLLLNNKISNLHLQSINDYEIPIRHVKNS